MLHELSRMLIIVGALILLMGLLLAAASKLPGMGRLPGDIVIKKDNFVFYFPLTTSLLLSFLASLVLWLISRR